MKSNGQKCAVDKKELDVEICSDENLSILCLSFFRSILVMFIMFSGPTHYFFHFSQYAFGRCPFIGTFKARVCFQLSFALPYIFDTNYDNLEYLLFLVVSKVHHLAHL